jgi:hypothetical protein
MLYGNSGLGAHYFGNAPDKRALFSVKLDAFVSFFK